MKTKVNVHGKFADRQIKMSKGMMINDGPDTMPYITQAAIQRKERMRQEKISMMEEAYLRAEMRSEMNKMMNGTDMD
jgi:hypothetical protein